jgi:phosphate transport system permease protein
MRRLLRAIFNKLFTGTAALSIALMAGALLIILGPMILKGLGAVFFDGTVEWRKLQLREEIFQRGDPDALAREIEQVNEARRPVYEMLDRFARGIDGRELESDVKRLHREVKKQLRNREDSRELTRDRLDLLEDRSKELRDYLREAYATVDKAEAQAAVQKVLDSPYHSDFKGTLGERYYVLATEYSNIVENVDLARREEYGDELNALKELLYKLFGPRPGERADASIAEFMYGATRWDIATKLRKQVLHKTRYVEVPGKKLLQPTQVSRAAVFDGQLDEMFALLRNDETFKPMMNPRFVFYWQYFTDDCLPGHLFGGVWPEIYGTVMLTVLAMVFAVPIGLVTAAYLVECAKDGLFVRIVRMCINTLAGVPSIVFGLFGLAFFLMVLLPKFGMESQSNILAGALTLGVMILPIIIRASEEAIRSVPQSYKEASLSLGAGGFRTFMTVTLPAALPGVLTGIILSMSRAAGETAPILFVAAVAYRKGVPGSIFSGGTRALSYSAYDVAVGDRVAMDAPHNQYGMIMTLVTLVLILNIVAILLRSRVAKKLRGQ